MKKRVGGAVQYANLIKLPLHHYFPYEKPSRKSQAT